MAIRLRDRRHDDAAPGKRRLTLSGTALKWTGFLLTCISTLGISILQKGLLKSDTYASVEEFTAAIADPANGLSALTSAMLSCAMIASMALPLYVKLVYEGWKRMEDRKPLFIRLALCALISEVPYDLAMRAKVLDFDVQNPVFGLLICAVMLEVLRIPKPRSRLLSGSLQILVILGALAWALLLQVYLGIQMVLLVTLFYFLEGNRNLSTLGGVLLTWTQFPAPLGMLFAHWYEADETKDGKYPDLFYILYPAQLLVLGSIGLLVGRMA